MKKIFNLTYPKSYCFVPLYNFGRNIIELYRPCYRHAYEI